MVVAAEVFANLASTTVSSGGTDAPSSGTVETWTVASSAEFAAASSTASPATQFHVSDPTAPSEIIAVTNISGTSWTVTRGAETTTPVTHAGGFTIQQVATAAVYNSFVQVANNLSDLASASTARTNLGLGSAATQASSAFDVAGAASTAQSNAESFATAAVATETSRAETAEALKAPLASPALTGSPTAPTQTTSDSSTKIATDAFVATAVATETTRAEAAEALAALKANNLSDLPSASAARANLGIGTSVVPPSGDTSGVTDAATIQAAVNGTQPVSLLADNYYVTGLAAQSYMILRGSGAGRTIINVVGSSANGLAGTDLRNVTLQDLSITGPGTGTGKGIVIGLSANASLPYLNFERVYVTGFGSNGVDLQSPQCSTFSNVISSLNGGYGFYFHSATATTSCTFNACYAIQNGSWGYYMQSVVYSALNGCAADKNAAGGYYWLDPQGVDMSGCGVEALTGVGMVIDGTGGGGGYGMMVSALWLYNTNSIGIHVTGGAQGITLASCVENSPGVTTVASGSNGGEISTIASWTHPSAGVLDVASTALLNPAGGTVTVATSTTTATITYTGTTGTSLTGCAYVSGSATGTVATGGTVTAPNAFIQLDSGSSAAIINPQNQTPNVLNGNYTYLDQNGQFSVSGPGGAYFGAVNTYGDVTINGGATLNMEGSKILDIANGSASTDAAAFGQIPVLDSTAADFQPDGNAAAGTTAKAADAGHAHPYSGAEPLTSGESIYARALAQGAVTLTSGTLFLSYWTAATSGTSTAVSTFVAGTAASGLTLANIGVFSVSPSPGNLTLLTSTGDLHTTLWKTTYTTFTSNWLANFTRVAGTRYALGFLAVGTTPPALGGYSGTGGLLDMSPEICGTITESSMPSTVTGSGITGGYQTVAATVAP